MDNVKSNEVPRNGSNIIGSIPLVKQIFAKLNGDDKLFCNRLDHIQLEWTKILNYRKAISVERTQNNNKTIFICLSEVGLRNANIKELVESIMVLKISFLYFYSLS